VFGIVIAWVGLLGTEHGDYSGINFGAFLSAATVVIWVLSVRFSRRLSDQLPRIATFIAAGPVLLVAPFALALFMSSHRDESLPTAYARPRLTGPLWQACRHPLDQQSHLNSDKLTTLIDSGKLNGADLRQALEDRGCIEEFLADDSMAIADYTRAIKLNPNNAALYFLRGRTLVNSNKYEDALTDYNSALRLAPGDAETYYRRAHVYEFFLHDHAKALADYDASIRLDANNPAAYHGRALVHLNLGHGDAAAADEAKAKRLLDAPSNPIASKRAAGEWE
jgi:tetratricopeptide (TPR) repeat protein